MGEHRQFVGKTPAYEEDIRVPFAIRGPGGPTGARLTPSVLNNDLAPTIAALADVAAPSYVAGRSFLPLLEDPEKSGRQTFPHATPQPEHTAIVGTATRPAERRVG